MSACECGRCGEQFSGIKSFDQHQRADYKAGTLTCLPPASLGLVRNRHGGPAQGKHDSQRPDGGPVAQNTV